MNRPRESPMGPSVPPCGQHRELQSHRRDDDGGVCSSKSQMYIYIYIYAYIHVYMCIYI